MFYLCGVIIKPHTAKVGNKTRKNNIMKQIKVTPNERRRLQERFDVGENYVAQVLSFAKDGPTARKIRLAALQLGGRYVDPDFAPNCRVQYVNGQIIQTFADQVVLTIDRESGNIILTHRGEIVDKAENATMNQWQAAAFYAQTVAESAMITK